MCCWHFHNLAAFDAKQKPPLKVASYWMIRGFLSEIIRWECLPFYPGVNLDKPNFLGIDDPPYAEIADKKCQ